MKTKLATGVPPKQSPIVPIIVGIVALGIGFWLGAGRVKLPVALKAYRDSLNAQNNAYIYDVRTNKIVGQNNWSSLNVATFNGNDTLGIFIVDKTISNASIFFDIKSDGAYVKKAQADTIGN